VHDTFISKYGMNSIAFQCSVAVGGPKACHFHQQWPYYWHLAAGKAPLDSGVLLRATSSGRPGEKGITWVNNSSIDGTERFTGSSHSGRVARDGADKFPTSKSKACFMLPHFQNIIAVLSTRER
jgi:hypothetical protein